MVFSVEPKAPLGEFDPLVTDEQASISQCSSLRLGIYPYQSISISASVLLAEIYRSLGRAPQHTILRTPSHSREHE